MTSENLLKSEWVYFDGEDEEDDNNNNTSSLSLVSLLHCTFQSFHSYIFKRLLLSKSSVSSQRINIVLSVKPFYVRIPHKNLPFEQFWSCKWHGAVKSALLFYFAVFVFFVCVYVCWDTPLNLSNGATTIVIEKTHINKTGPETQPIYFIDLCSSLARSIILNRGRYVQWYWQKMENYVVVMVSVRENVKNNHGNAQDAFQNAEQLSARFFASPNW